MHPEIVVVSAEEVSDLQPIPYAQPNVFVRPKPSIPVWARLGISVLVPVMPLLALVTLILRIAFRHQPAGVRYAWTSFLSTLLIVSGFFSTIAAVLLFSFAPVPAIVNSGLPDLDERTQFTSLPAPAALSSSEASEQLKPLVVVVSPASRLWNRQVTASPYFGAGVLLFADKTGYLFATANHVVRGGNTGSGDAPKDAMVSTAAGVWSSAQVVATAPGLDLALLWIARHSGSADFLQPITTARDGAVISVIGHPEGLKYTLSTGIISGIRSETLQVSAPISPGNSGGPVYDDHGNLLGIVSSKFDHNIDPNAENIGFAVKAQALLQASTWNFAKDGKQMWQRYVSAISASRGNTATPESPTK
jgi:S1-C subfamily serine protease